MTDPDVATTDSPPGALAALIDREGRRIRNGIRYARGHRFTELKPTKKDLVWSQGKIELHRYRNDNVRFHPPVVLMLGLVSKSPCSTSTRGPAWPARWSTRVSTSM